jgi:uncharacterized membrane protein YdjX (TVP38/TMEM64 family)
MNADSEVHNNAKPKGAGQGGVNVGKLGLLAIAAALFGGALYFFGDQLSLQTLVDREAAFERYRQDHPVLVYAVAFGIYVGATGLSLPGAWVLSLAFAWFFGFWRGLILVSFASTTGATIAFLFSRYVFRDAIQSRFGERLTNFNETLEREGAFYLFSLRIIPAVPFFVINLVMGLTPISVRTYWWVSQVGMLPGTCVYVFVGSQIPKATELAELGPSDILDWPILVAFVLLGVFPFVVRKVMSRVRRSSGDVG